MNKDNYRYEYWKDQHSEHSLDVKHLVVDTDKYIVWVDSKNKIDWISHKEKFDDAGGPADENLHSKILNKVALLSCKPNLELPSKVYEDFVGLLGEALARSFAGCYEEAETILLEADIFITRRGEELARHWQLIASGKIIAWLLVFAIVFWLIRNCIISFIGQPQFIMIYAIIAGAIGAFFSQSVRLGKEPLDCHAGKNLHEWESRFKIFAGMISGFAITLSLNSGLFFSSIVLSERTNHLIVLLGLFAGLSERLIPSISKKIEKTL